MRLALNNKSDTATLTASSTAGTLVVGNLKTIYKSQVWRSTGPTASLTVVWPVAQQISVVAFPFCSFSSSATIRVRGYTNSADTVPAVDTGVQLAIPPLPMGSFDWGGQPLGVNAYSTGGYATCVVWLTLGAYAKLEIDIDDTFNPLGYVEAGRLFCSSYHQFEYCADYGSSISMSDADQQFRNMAGDLLTDKGATYKTLSVNLANLGEGDKLAVLGALRAATKARPVLVCAAYMPGDSVATQHWTIFGKLNRNSEITAQSFGQYSTDLTLEEA